MQVLQATTTTFQLFRRTETNCECGESVTNYDATSPTFGTPAGLYNYVKKTMPLADWSSWQALSVIEASADPISPLVQVKQKTELRTWLDMCGFEEDEEFGGALALTVNVNEIAYVDLRGVAPTNLQGRINVALQKAMAGAKQTVEIPCPVCSGNNSGKWCMTCAFNRTIKVQLNVSACVVEK